MATAARCAAILASIWLLAGGAEGGEGACGPREDAQRASHRPLTGSDFSRGVPRDALRAPDGQTTDILITTAIGVDGLDAHSEAAGSGFVAYFRAQCVQAYLIKERTGRRRAARPVWDGQTETSRSDLRHEQGHFDLTQSCALRLGKEIAQLEQRAAHAAEAERRLRERAAALYRAASAACQELQDRYDRETRHGHKPHVQTRWLGGIAAGLADARKAPSSRQAAR